MSTTPDISSLRLDDTPTLPIPIPRVGNNYLLFDLAAVTYLRQTHNIPGVLIGSIPQAPSQNVFHGLPAHLMPEEARLLVEKGIAYIVDDVEAHGIFLDGLDMEERRKLERVMKARGVKAAEAATERAEKRKKKGLQRAVLKGELDLNAAEAVDTMSQVGDVGDTDKIRGDEAMNEEDPDISLFSTTTPSLSQHPKSRGPNGRHFVTPTTSHPPFPSNRPAPSTPHIPRVPDSYHLFRHLHSRGYFMFPGLRFGCHYTVYPGDPLRFHSHFLAVGMRWEEEFDILDIVGGGRLGTGVKKGYLIGGKDESTEGKEKADDGVRTFCIEWASM
jgi:tRNA-splicing endonuclease subunit Sen34